MNSIQPLPEGPQGRPGPEPVSNPGFSGAAGGVTGRVQGPSCFSIIFLWTFLLIIEVKFTSCQIDHLKVYEPVTLVS